MAADIWDDIIDNANKALVPFNPYLLKGYRQEQIKGCIEYLKMTFIEAIKVFGIDMKFKDYRILRPEDRIKEIFDNPKYTATVDVRQTELMLVDFRFEYEKQIYSVKIYLPYLYNEAIVVNNSKYYIQFSLTDKVFYHISKDNGLGIKVLRSHLRFWRNFKHSFHSVTGNRYSDNILLVKIHFKSYKPTAEDIRTTSLLYPLCEYGWNNTLEHYNINPKHVRMVNEYDVDDKEHEYFFIRSDNTENKTHLYLKIHKTELSTNPTIEEKIKLRVITAIHYLLQYFVRCKTTIYDDNIVLAKTLMDDNDKTVWRIILGKTIYGIDNKTEIQVHAQAVQHLDSLDSFLDPYTKIKLRDINVKCNNIYDLIDHIFTKIDDYVINYFPADLYQKRLNVLDLLLGNIVHGIFLKVYAQTNNRKANAGSMDPKDVVSILKAGSKAISQIHKATGVISGNPSVYNDNYLITVGCRKTRATFTSTTVTKKNKQGQVELAGSKNKQTNLMNNSEHRFHPSNAYVESMMHINHQSPSINGMINPFLPISNNGDIIKEDYSKDIDALSKYLITK